MGETVWEFISPLYDYKSTLGLSNIIFAAHRYGDDFPGFKGKDLDPSRFEFVLKERGEAAPEESEQVKRLRTRLGHLGY